MHDEDNNFNDPLVLYFRKWWRLVQVKNLWLKWRRSISYLWQNGGKSYSLGTHVPTQAIREKAPLPRGVRTHLAYRRSLSRDSSCVIFSCSYHRSGWVKQARLRFNALKAVWDKTRSLQACVLRTVHLFCRYSLTQLEGCRRLVHRYGGRL